MRLNHEFSNTYFSLIIYIQPLQNNLYEGTRNNQFVLNNQSLHLSYSSYHISYALTLLHFLIYTNKTIMLTIQLTTIDNMRYFAFILFVFSYFCNYQIFFLCFQNHSINFINLLIIQIISLKIILMHILKKNQFKK